MKTADALEREMLLATRQLRRIGAERPKIKLDGWRTEYDRWCRNRGRSYWGSYVLPPEYAMSLYNASAMAARVCNILPDEATREPFTWEDADDALKERFTALHLQDLVCDAASWGRAAGGSAILIGVADVDDEEAGEPLDRTSPGGEVAFLEVFDRRQLQIGRLYGDGEDNENPEKRGQPSHYKIADPAYDSEVYWHESRFILFGGARTPPKEKRENDHWDYSVLQGIEEDILGYEDAWAEARYMLKRSEQNVILINNWADTVAGLGDALARARASEIDRDRDAAHALVLDKERESFQKFSSNFSSIPELLDRQANKIAAGINVPITVLMRNSPSGLNATGEVDLKLWYGTVGQYQRNEIHPRALPLAGVIAAGMGRKPPKLCFPSLWSETKAEAATRRKVTADTDVLYLQYDALTVADIAQKRFVEGDFDNPPKIEKVPTLTGEPAGEYDKEKSANAKPPAGPSSTAVAAEGSAQTLAVNPAAVLNGAQITAALEVVRAVNAGEISRDAGVALLENGFNLPNDKASAMIGTPPEKPAAPAPTVDGPPSPGNPANPPPPQPFPPRPPAPGTPPAAA